MRTIAIVVADAARARVLTFQPFAEPSAVMGGLRERAALVDPARRLRPGELLSETRPPSNRTPTGLGFAVDDHREGHMEELDRRFASTILAEVEKIVELTNAYRLVVVASPNILGLLREQYSDTLRRAVGIDEVARDLTHESVPRLARHLTDLGLLPRPLART